MRCTGLHYSKPNKHCCWSGNKCENYHSKYKIIIKTHILTAALSSPKLGSESSVPKLSTPPALLRENLFSSWSTRDSLTDPFNEKTTFVTWWCLFFNGDSPDTVPTKALQAWMPSAHVWSKFVSPTSPQFLNQAPPRAQQLPLPDFLVATHLMHNLSILPV